MSAIDYCICIEELARVDPAVALSVAAHNGLCTAHIAMFGTEAQRRRYLKTRVAGADNQNRTLRHRDSPTGRAQGLPMSSPYYQPI